MHLQKRHHLHRSPGGNSSNSGGSSSAGLYASPLAGLMDIAAVTGYDAGRGGGLGSEEVVTDWEDLLTTTAAAAVTDKL